MKVVFFDLGGTLLIMRRDRIFCALLAKVGYNATLEKIHGAYAFAESRWLREYGFRNLGPEKSVESYRRLDAMAFRHAFPESTAKEAASMSKMMREQWPDFDDKFLPKMYPDAEPTLAKLKRKGYDMGLISNAPPDTAGVVERLKLQRFMNIFVISGIVGVSKPNPEIFRIALSKAGVKAFETVHVGDVYASDVVGARNAGVKGILIQRDSSSNEYGCPTIGSLQEVFAHLG